jgi:hypothetical protein
MMNNNNTTTEEFCRRYEARVERTGRYHRRAEPSPWKISDYRETSSIADERFLHFVEVPLVAITLPEDRLGALIEHERRVTDMIERKPMYPTKYSVLDHIIREHEEECRLRSTNPALKKAWDNYQLLLRIHGR